MDRLGHQMVMVSKQSLFDLQNVLLPYYDQDLAGELSQGWPQNQFRHDGPLWNFRTEKPK